MGTSRYSFWKETAPGNDEYVCEWFSSDDYRETKREMRELDTQGIASFITTERSQILKHKNKQFEKRFRDRLRKACVKNQSDGEDSKLIGGLDF